MKALKYIMICAVTLIFTSCDDFLDETPESNLTDDEVFANVDNAEAAVNGAYRSLVGQGYYGRNLSLSTALSAQELKDPNNTNSTYLEFINHQVQPYNSMIESLWADIYYSVSASNKIIAYVPGVEGDQATINRLLAEGHFLRGLHYFNLVRLFGNVPLYLEPIVNTNPDATQLPNATIEQVYQQVRTDLETAEDMMPADFNHPGRASLLTIKAILAKLYLYLEEYELAEEYAAEVIAGPYTLSSDYAAIFTNPGESESILEIQFNERTGSNGIRIATLPDDEVYGGQATLASYYEGSSSSKTYPFMDFYPDGDIRKDTLFYPFENNNYIIKYTANPTYDNVSLIRLPEVLLIYAEAVTRNAQAVTPEAFEAYNAVRTRAGVPQEMSGFTSASEFIDAIVEEKRREMVLENESWFDYVRAGKADELGVTNPNYYIYPIPQIERDVNPNLKQNEGYGI